MAQEEPKPINEWLFDEYIRVKDALKDLAERHETVVNNYAAVCRQNDRMRAAGDELRNLIAEIDATDDPLVDKAIQAWGDAQI